MNFLWWGNSSGTSDEAAAEKPKSAEAPAQQKPKESPLTEELAGLKKKLDVQEGVREELRDNKGKAFWEGLLGGGAVSTLLGEVHTWMWGKSSLDWKDFEAELARALGKAKGEPFDIEEYIVAHRALGYGRHKENSLEAIQASLDGGEGQIEIDLRRDKNGKICLAHSDISVIDGEEEQLVPLEVALDVFARHEKNRDAVIFFDIKEEGILEELDEKVARVDEEYKDKPDYQPLAQRHFVVSFNEEVLKRAKDKNKERPVIFCYIPSKKAANIAEMVSTLGYTGLSMLTGAIDSITGTRMQEDLARTRVKLNGKDIGDSSGRVDSLSMYDELPPDEILATVDYICIPGALATKELVAKAHSKGIKVAVWGPTVEGGKIQEAFADLDVDLAISDKADVIEDSSSTEVASASTPPDKSDESHSTDSDSPESPENQTA